MKDKNGKIIRQPYVIKVLNTINFSKSMKYNPFEYLHSEKDILKLVNTIIVQIMLKRNASSATAELLFHF